MNSQDEKQEDIGNSKQDLNNLEKFIQSQCNDTENLCKQTGFAVDSHAMEDAKKYAAAASKLALNAQICMEKFRRQHHEEMGKLQDKNKDEKDKLKKQLTDLEKKVRETTNHASFSAELVKNKNPITLEILGSFATLFFKFAATYGFLVLFIHIYKINWLPIGISLSETGIFLLLGVGVTILILYLCVTPSLIIGLTITECKSRNLPLSIIYVIFLVLFFILNIIIFFIPNKNEIELSIFLPYFLPYLILVAAVGIIIYFLIIDSFPRKDIKYLFYILSLFLFVLSIFTIINSHKHIVTSLGLLKPETAIQLSESDFKIVQEQVCQRKIANCNEKNRIVWPVRVLLRGIGTHSLISFNNNEGKELRMEVKTDESKLIDIPQEKDNTQNKAENCSNPNASAPAAASAATSLEAITASTETICDDDKMNPNL